jgi:hypothetical protein
VPPPEMTPEVGAATAIAVLLLDQVPPEGVAESVVVALAQNVVVPLIVEGVGCIVTAAVAKHPPVRV